MANFSKLIITEQGKKLLQDSFLSGEAILYTQIGVADHSYEEEELEALKELQHIRQIQAVRKIERENGDTVVLDTVFDNKNVQEGYFFRTIGLYAKSEGQEELLFAVAAERSNASYMPEHTGITTSIQVKLRVKLDNGETIHITVDPAGTATIGDVMDVRSWLETHIGDRDNPHHVTPEQLGVESEANHYVHPAAHPADMVTQDENHRFVTDEQKQVWDGKMEKNGDSAENTAVYTSGDGTNPAGWTDVAVMASGEKHKTFLNKLSTMAKNVRWLYKMLGTTNIASIGGGTLTGAISSLNTGLDSHTHDNRYYTEAEINSKINLLTCSGASVNVGYTTDGVTKSVANNTRTVMTTITIAKPGYYILTADTNFSKNGTGFRLGTFSSTADGTSNTGTGVNVPANSSNMTTIQNVYLLKTAAANSKIYFAVQQTSGGALNASTWIGVMPIRCT